MSEHLTKDQQPIPKPWVGWELSNWGIARGVYRTRRMAIDDACASSGEGWQKTRKYFAVRKVRVMPV